MSDKSFSDIAICYNCVNYNRESQFCRVHNNNTQANHHCSQFDKADDKTSEDIMEEAMRSFENMNDMAEKFIKVQPLWYDRNKILWKWNYSRLCWEMIDETDLMNEIDKALKHRLINTTKHHKKQEIWEAVKRKARMNEPEPAPKHWIQCGAKIYDIKTEKIIESSPKYFITNPIPFEIGDSEETPIIDKLFMQWVGQKYVQTLYEIIAYSMLCDYPIHIALVCIGNGRNGKSTFQRLMQKLFGAENICSTELDTLLNSRFETAKLHKKLVCFMGETNFGTLRKTSLFKKLTGQDPISFEYKGKMPFDDYNYSTIIISSNSMPTSDDTSDGFYRRWLILDFPYQFPEGKDILETIPENEYNNLTLKCLNLLPGILQKGELTNQGTVEQRKEKYLLASNPLPTFIERVCEFDDSVKEEYPLMYQAYMGYCKDIKRRQVSKKDFTNLLTNEGYITEGKTQVEADGGRVKKTWIHGLRLKNNWKEILKKEVQSKL